MTIFQSFLMGIIQGLTEFIPVSSTAHLLLGQKLLGIQADEYMFSFLVIVQLGTILSLLVFFWRDAWQILIETIKSLKTILQGKTGEITPNARLGWFILLATLPALLAGYLLKDAIESLFQMPLVEAAIRLGAAAILLTLAEWLGNKSRTLETMKWWDALFIGVFQVIAVFPGASRSGTTISAGLFRGFDRKAAARFAFLMSIPVMLAAGGYEMLDVVQMPGLADFLPILLVGFVTAAVVGWFAIKWLLDYLGKHSLYVFAIYCGFLCLITILFAVLQ
jgi:undecaprenyl-diphosphatase